MPFLKAQVGFPSILHQSSVPSNITPLYLFSWNTIYFDQKEPIIVQIFEIFRCPGQNSSNYSCQIWNDKSIPLRNFPSFFIVRTHNLSVNFKLIRFLLWIKRSHQSPNFEIFKCSGKSLWNSSCHFPNHKSFFFKFSITLQCHERWFLCTFLSQTLYTLLRRSPLKCKFLRLLSVRVKIRQILHVNFEETSQFLIKFCVILLCHNT